MDARNQAIVRAEHISAPEDKRVEALCEEIGYGAVMDAAARLWARKDSLGALYIAGECLSCRDLETEAGEIRRAALNEIADLGQRYDSKETSRAGK